MNKKAIQKYAVWARNELIDQVKQRAYQYGITDKSYGEENASVINGRALSPMEKRQRNEFVSRIKDLMSSTPYSLSPTPYNAAFQAVVEEVAYTWFNRFAALRFMEVNDYLPSHIRVLGSRDEGVGNGDKGIGSRDKGAGGRWVPEILNEALYLEKSAFPDLDKAKVSELLNANQTEELYRYLLLTQCNALNAALPEMFERLGGYTELLLPNNILKQDGVIGRLVTDIPEEDWRDAVQIIGWLYQYYNTEPKQAVFDGLKKNVKITKEKIPAATQLFTPDWIVRYMVENSLGRIYIGSKVQGVGGREEGVGNRGQGVGSREEGVRKSEAERIAKEKEIAEGFGWKYYIPEAEQPPEVRAQLDPTSSSLSTTPYSLPPLNIEDIKVLDPCMGSGHILVYAFDVLMQIYESEGYNPREAVKLILEKNLYGLDIDRRAYQLAWFALMMKARQYDRRIFTHEITPKVFSLVSSEGVSARHFDLMGEGFSPLEIEAAKNSLKYLITQFADATEFGSLIKVEEYIDFNALREFVKNVRSGQLSIDADISGLEHLERTQSRLLEIIDIAQILANKYDVVVTNPPYMGSSGMGPKLSQYVKDIYPDSKSDLSTAFMEQTLYLCKPTGFMAMINIPVWMFITSYEKLRQKLLSGYTIVNLLHFGRGVFGADFGTTSFVIQKGNIKGYYGTYRKLYKQQGSVDSIAQKEEWFFADMGFFRKQQEKYKNIPGSPIAYSLNDVLVEVFSTAPQVSKYASPKQGMSTCDVDRFVKRWYEIDVNRTNIYDPENIVWVKYNKGGEYRKWFGNREFLVYWNSEGDELSANNAALRNRDVYFQRFLAWTKVTISTTGFRWFEDGFLFDGAGGSLFTKNQCNALYLLGYLNSIVATDILKVISPTVNYNENHIGAIPVKISNEQKSTIESLVERNIEISRFDWDAFETSWDFKRHPLL